MNKLLHPTVQSLSILFSLLKGKLRKSKFLDMRKVEAIRWVIVTCCIVHNFLLVNESFDEDMDESQRYVDESEIS